MSKAAVAAAAFFALYRLELPLVPLFSLIYSDIILLFCTIKRYKPPLFQDNFVE